MILYNVQKVLRVTLLERLCVGLLLGSIFSCTCLKNASTYHKTRVKSQFFSPPYFLSETFDCHKGTSINDVPRFLPIFDLPNYYLPTLSYSMTSNFRGYFGPPYLPPTDVVNECSHKQMDTPSC